MSTEISDRIERVVRAAAERLRALPEAAAAERPRPGKWSPKEILGHLIDSASHNHRRFVQAQLTADLVFEGYAQDDWVRVQRYQEADWRDLIQLWTAYNLHIARVVAAIPRGVLERQRKRHNLDRIAWRTVPDSQPVTLDYFVRDYLAHLEHHLGQILG